VDIRTINTLSLCSGYGGLELGIDLATQGRNKTVAYVEWEAYAQATLVARMEESTLDKAPIWDDLTTFDGKPWRGKVDLITAGFPCQPWSVAGRQKGIEDDRWIWEDIFRIVCEVQPSYVFLENVTGLINGGLEHVLGSLAQVGFDAEWCSVKASDVGAAHQRERVFILAYTDGFGWDGRNNGDERRSKRTAQTERSCCELEDPNSERLERGFTQGQDTKTALPSNQLAHTKHDGSHAKQERGSNEETIRDNKERKEQAIQSEGICGAKDVEGYGVSYDFPPGPTSELWGELLRERPEVKPHVCRVHDGDLTKLVSPYRTDRLRLLGNGVVPQQAAFAFALLLNNLSREN
jgi:DNA (cytosine-5)-methyltransferase 1